MLIMRHAVPPVSIPQSPVAQEKLACMQVIKCGWPHILAKQPHSAGDRGGGTQHAAQVRAGGSGSGTSLGKGRAARARKGRPQDRAIR